MLASTRTRAPSGRSSSFIHIFFQDSPNGRWIGGNHAKGRLCDIRLPPPLPLPSLAGGMRISTSVPSGTGSGSWRMITSPFTCPLYLIVQFPLRGGQQPWSPRQTSGRLPTQVMYGFGTPCGRGPNHQHVLLIVVPAPFFSPSTPQTRPCHGRAAFFPSRYS